MSAMPIEWHDDRLANCRQSYMRAIELRDREIKRLCDNVDRLAVDIRRSEEQIKRAKKLGKKSFDSEKFMKGKI